MTTFDPVLLSLIRRVWPTVIANSLIGTQPITGQAGQIFGMRSRYAYEWRFKMIDKRYFKNFLRLNDRKQSFSTDEITTAKYPLIRLTQDQIDNREVIWEWCNENVGKYHWINNNYNVIVFSDEQFVTLFKLVWG